MDVGVYSKQILTADSWLPTCLNPSIHWSIHSAQKISNLPSPLHFPLHKEKRNFDTEIPSSLCHHITNLPTVCEDRGGAAPSDFPSLTHRSRTIRVCLPLLLPVDLALPTQPKPFSSVFKHGQVSHIFKNSLSPISLANYCLLSSSSWSDSWKTFLSSLIPFPHFKST